MKADSSSEILLTIYRHGLISEDSHTHCSYKQLYQ